MSKIKIFLLQTLYSIAIPGKQFLAKIVKSNRRKEKQKTVFLNAQAELKLGDILIFCQKLR